jgi:iron complex outermembrane recepter protein
MGRVKTMLAVAVAFACSLQLQAQTATNQFNLPSQPLSESLKTVAAITNVNVLFDSDETAAHMAPALSGNVTVDQALTTLLMGSGLKPRYLNEKTVVLERVRDEVKTSSNSQGQDEEMRMAQAGSGSETAPDKSSAGEKSDEAKLEEIVVTAQKREERLQDVPISISVLDGTTLDKSTDQGVTEALNRVPGVATTVTRGFGTARITVRGVGASSFVSNGGNAIGYYVDSIPFGFTRNAIAPDANAYDMDRIEVLRGPQGTLYGVSALNGVVRILTKDADLNDFEAKARGSYSSTEHGGNNYRGDLAVNVPIVEGKLAARAVLGHQELSGWIDKPIRKDMNDAEIDNARLKINAQPTENFSVGMFAWLSRTETGGWNNSPDNRRNAQVLEEPGSIDYDAYGLTMAYDLPAFSIVSMTSYIDYQNEAFFDYRPFFIENTLLRTQLEASVLSEELVLSSNSEGPWRWTAGGIYRDGDERMFQFRRQYIEQGGGPSDQTTASQSYAVFGELTRLFLDGRLELTGGLRYFEDDISDREISRNNANPAPLINTDSSFDAVTPRVVLTWHPRDQVTIYTSYAEGFRSGLNQTPPVRLAAPAFGPADPDKLHNYELGAKFGGLADGRITLDTAVFFIDWQDVQQTLSVLVAPTILNPALVNAESASGVGFEFAAVAEPFERFTVALNASWNDLTVDEDTLSSGIVLFPKGSRLNWSPETTAGASLAYEFPLGALEGRVAVAANYISEQDVRGVVAGAVQIGEGDSILIAGANLSLASDRGWTASLFVDNLNDENGIAVVDTFSPQWHGRIRPRTYGLQLEYAF